MDIPEAIAEYVASCHHLSHHTQKFYSTYLKVFADWCREEKLELEDLRASHLRKFMDYVGALPNKRTGMLLSDRSVHHYAQIVKGFLSWSSKEDGYDDLVRPSLPKKIAMPRVEQKVVETFTAEQVAALLRACEREGTDELVKRDVAIICVLMDTGIRASELCSLTLDRVILDPTDPYIKVKGKGRKEREVGLGIKARKALQRYISRYRGVRADGRRVGGEYVFLSRTGLPLEIFGLESLFDRLGEWAKIKGVRCSPHTCRHTYAAQYLLNGGDVYKLSRTLGHTSVTITEGYLRSVKAKDARNGKSVLDSL